MMKNLKVIFLIFLVGTISVLLGGCLFTPKKAEIRLDLTPSVRYISETTDMTIALREMNEVGVNLDYIKFQIYDEWGSLWLETEIKGQDASEEFDEMFGTHYLYAKGTLQRTFYNQYESGPAGRYVYIMGGIDDNGNSVRASDEYSVRRK